jgi:hypothetical protein
VSDLARNDAGESVQMARSDSELMFGGSASRPASRGRNSAMPTRTRPMTLGSNQLLPPTSDKAPCVQIVGTSSREVGGCRPAIRAKRQASRPPTSSSVIRL